MINKVFCIKYHKNLERATPFDVFCLLNINSENLGGYTVAEGAPFSYGVFFVPKEQEEFDVKKHENFWLCHCSEKDKILRAILTLSSFYGQRFSKRKIEQEQALKNKIAELQEKLKDIQENGAVWSYEHQTCSFGEYESRMKIAMPLLTGCAMTHLTRLE